MSVDAQLRVNGVPLGFAGLPYGDLSWTDRADGGNFEASWSMELEYGSRPGAMYSGALVEIYLGLSRRWYGLLDVLNWDDGTFTAKGMSRYAESFTTYVSGATNSSTPDTVIDRAITAGWQVARYASFSASPVVVGDDTEAPNFVGPILDLAALNLGQRWGVWGDGVVQRYAAPAVPTLYLAPGVIDFGQTSEESFSTLVFRFIDSATSLPNVVVRSNGTLPVSESVYDATDQGAMTATVAGTIADNIVGMGVGSQGWTSSVEAASAQLLGSNGHPVELASATAGGLMRAWATDESGIPFRDVQVGEVKFTVGSDTITLAPTEKVATSLSEVVEDMYARLTGTPVAA